MSKTNSKNIYLYIVLIAASLLLAVTLNLLSNTSQMVYAKGISQTSTVETLTYATRRSYTPTITITQPSANEILTQTPQTVLINYDCGGTLCLGSNMLDVISISVNGPTGAYTPAMPLSTTGEGGTYTYTWNLEKEDYAQHVLMAKARNAGGSLGISEPITTYVDMISPQGGVITAPSYTQALSFTVYWNAYDGSGEIWYNLDYRLDDQITWTTWITHSQITSKTFSLPSQTFIVEGHTYTFRMQATDRGHNTSDWVFATTRIGKQSLYLPLIQRNYAPRWQQVTNTAGMRFRTPTGCGENIWYAGTSDNDGLWKSTGGIATWSKLADLQPDTRPVVANPQNCNEAFAAVWKPGIQRIVDSTVENITGNLEEPYIYGLALENNTLYAGTNSKGIYKTDTTNINWQAMNTGLTDLRIRSLFAIDDKIYAGSRGCMLYVSNDGGNNWGVQTVLTANCDDAQVWSIQPVKDILYAGLGLDKGLYYLDGSIWKQVEAIPNSTIRGIAYEETHNYLYVSTDGSGIYRCGVGNDGVATSCAPYQAGLTTLGIQEIKIHNNLIVAGTRDGLWYRQLLP